ELIPLTGAVGIGAEVIACVGAGVVIGLMACGLLGKRWGFFLGVAAAVAALPSGLHMLRDYPVLLSSLMAYGMSAIVCTALSLRNTRGFDFDLIGKRGTNFEAP